MSESDKPQAEEGILIEGEVPPAGPAPRRGPGHRAADARDTAAEMAARAHEISLEAGSKMASVMREVIGAAAGFSNFAIESSRDLIHYMVRRGQMGQAEGDVLIQQAEAAYIAKHGSLPKPEPKPAPPKPVPLGQLPKAVTAPAAAAEAALEARAAMRLEPQRPSDRGIPLVMKAVVKPVDRAVEKAAEKIPDKPPMAKPATKAAEKGPSAPTKATVVPATKPSAAPAAKSATAKAPAKSPAKAPAKVRRS